MDTQIKLRHKATEQECVFDDESAADDFLANVAAPNDWAKPGAVPLATKTIDINLPELRDQLAADKASEAAPAPDEAPVAPVKTAKPRAKK